MMSLLFHINSSLSNEQCLLSKSVYSVQNKSWVIAISSSGNPWNNVLITLLTCFLWSLYEWSFAYLWVWVITHSIHPVASKSVLICICLFCHILHTTYFTLFNISESILSGSSVSIFYSSSVPLYDELHTLKDDDLDTGNSSLLSISDDDLIMDIFVILE